MNPLTCTYQHITVSKTEIHKTKRHGKSEGWENRVHSKTLKFKVSKNVVPVLHNETPRKITGRRAEHHGEIRSFYLWNANQKDCS